MGVEFGSTRIKAAVIDKNFVPVSSGEYVWQSAFENGIWTYELDEALRGLKAAVSGVENPERIEYAGISGMMHGYLAFDGDWNLLTPFRTWQNTITGEAAAALTDAFGFNIPQRWSAAHLYRAILNGEEHVPEIAHITTLSGYIHYLLTGVNAVGICEASGMFPVDGKTNYYNAEMLRRFNELARGHGFGRDVEDILPRVLPAGANAGKLTESGAALLGGKLRPGVPFAPPEGDAATGMVAANAVAPRTGNISAGTSVFATVVLERPLRGVHPEIDIVTAPSGRDAAMIHCNNGTNDSNAWVSLFKEAAALFGGSAPDGEAYSALYRRALEGNPDCGGVLVCNYVAGESVVRLDSGVPMLVREQNANFTLANVFRAALYSSLATLRLGLDILAEENVKTDGLTGHGGFFKTPGVGQRFAAAACAAPVTCRESAGEGGPYGAALLSAYACLKGENETLGAFLSNRVFAGSKETVTPPDPADAAGFEKYMRKYRRLLEIERKATEVL